VRLPGQLQAQRFFAEQAQEEEYVQDNPSGGDPLTVQVVYLDGPAYWLKGHIVELGSFYEADQQLDLWAAHGGQVSFVIYIEDEYVYSGTYEVSFVIYIEDEYVYSGTYDLVIQPANIKRRVVLYLEQLGGENAERLLGALAEQNPSELKEGYVDPDTGAWMSKRRFDEGLDDEYEDAVVSEPIVEDEDLAANINAALLAGTIGIGQHGLAVEATEEQIREGTPDPTRVPHTRERAADQGRTWPPTPPTRRDRLDMVRIRREDITGRRVRTTQLVDRHPNFIVEVGKRGSVDEVTPDEMFWVKFDEPITGAEEWDNRVEFQSIEEFLRETEFIDADPDVEEYVLLRGTFDLYFTPDDVGHVVGSVMLGPDGTEDQEGQDRVRAVIDAEYQPGVQIWGQDVGLWTVKLQDGTKFDVYVVPTTTAVEEGWIAPPCEVCGGIERGETCCPPEDDTQRAERLLTEKYGQHQGLNADWNSMAWLVGPAVDDGMWWIIDWEIRHDDGHNLYSLIKRAVAVDHQGEYLDAVEFTGPVDEVMNEARLVPTIQGPEALGAGGELPTTVLDRLFGPARPSPWINARGRAIQAWKVNDGEWVVYDHQTTDGAAIYRVVEFDQATRRLIADDPIFVGTAEQVAEWNERRIQWFAYEAARLQGVGHRRISNDMEGGETYITDGEIDEDGNHQWVNDAIGFFNEHLARAETDDFPQNNSQDHSFRVPYITYGSPGRVTFRLYGPWRIEERAAIFKHRMASSGFINRFNIRRGENDGICVQLFSAVNNGIRDIVISTWFAGPNRDGTKNIIGFALLNGDNGLEIMNGQIEYDAIVDWKRPKTVREIMDLLGVRAVFIANGWPEDYYLHVGYQDTPFVTF